jgi:putative phosphoesterase
MDIGIISDIHGDLAALETALDRLDHFHHVEMILCAGDLVGRGHQQDEVVQRIRERAIPTVRGNHDEWDYPLSPENTRFLLSLPLEWRANINGSSLYMCHGKPGNNLWGLYRDHISETLLNMMLKSLNTDVMITGHTHVPLYVRVQRGCVVNAGSLYTFDTSRSSSRSYGVLHLHDLSFDVYDLTTAPGERVLIG